MAVIGVVERTGLFFGGAVRAPDILEQDGAERVQLRIELGDAGAELGMHHFVHQQIDDLFQFAAVRRRAGQFIERGISLHEVHMDVQGFTVAAVHAARFERPVAMEHLPVAAILAVGGAALDHVKGHFSVLAAARIAGGQAVLGQGIDPKALTVHDFAVLDDAAALIRNPVPAAMAAVPEMFGDKIHSLLGGTQALPSAQAVAVAVRHGIDHAQLADQRLVGFTGRLAVAIEITQKTAELPVD